MAELLQNPVLLIGLMCGCWPGLLPVVAAWYVGRNYDFQITTRKKAVTEEIDI